MGGIIHWLLHLTGSDDGSGSWYLWWSGFFSTLTIFTAGFVVVRKVNCHASRCFRVGIHHVEGTPYVTCRKHHPVVPTGRVSVGHIHDAHRDAAASKEDP